MKLAVLGGGGVRTPLLVSSLLAGPSPFDEIVLFEPDRLRAATLGRLSVELGRASGERVVVGLTEDLEEAVDDAAVVFSAVRVGGDRGRVVDEQVAVAHGLVGQETTGPGGAAMALRALPIVLEHARALERSSPAALFVNMTNPVGIVTQALAAGTSLRVVGVCDTPSSTLEQLARFLDVAPGGLGYAYGGLNHLGWICSIVQQGSERIHELVARYDELRAFDHRFGALDAALVRRLGAIPTEYLYYFYEAGRYASRLATTGASRGIDVAGMNEELVRRLGTTWSGGGLSEAWAIYRDGLDRRRRSYLALELDAAGSGAPATGAEVTLAGYEQVAMQVVQALLDRSGPARLIVNTRNGRALPFLEPDDVVEVPALLDASGVTPLAGAELPTSARALVEQVKEYERGIVDAAVQESAEAAALSLALHPLVPGLSAARTLVAEYRDRHGPTLAYLR